MAEDHGQHGLIRIGDTARVSRERKKTFLNSTRMPRYWVPLKKKKNPQIRFDTVASRLFVEIVIEF